MTGRRSCGRRSSSSDWKGGSPGRDTGMLLSIDQPESKKTLWSKRNSDFITAGWISPKESESLNGRLSFSRTSIFGRIGRGMMHPLYRKLRADYYQGILSVADVSLLQWWKGVLQAIRHMVVSARIRFPQKIIYTDAAAENSVAAAIVFHRGDFLGSKKIETFRGMYADAEWVALFSKANLIYGRELMAVVQTAADPSVDLGGKCVTFYVAGNNNLSALVRADSEGLAISILARIFWAICIKLSIAPWF